MRKVSFPWPQRLEMAVAWAFPMSLMAVLLSPFWSEGVLPLVGLVWGASLLIFLSFPFYQAHLRTTGRNVGLVFFNFGEKGVLLLLWLFFLLCVAVYTGFSDDFSWAMFLRWGLVSLIVLLILGLDLTGSTPTYKSGLHQDRLLHIELDSERCKGVGFCEQVCPTDVFTIDQGRQLALLPNAQHCVQCGACIVQCPFDALCFRSSHGDVVVPDTIRKFKLNMLGSSKVG